MQEISGVVLKKYCRCCVGEIQISAGAAVTARGKYGETSIGRQQLGEALLCSVCVRHTVCGIPGIPAPFHTCQAFHSPTHNSDLLFLMRRALQNFTITVTEFKQDLVQVHTYSYVKSRSGRHKELLSKLGKKMPNLEILCAFFKSIYQPQLKMK